MSVLDFLAQVSGFDSLDRRALAHLEQQIKVGRYAAGAQIIRRGDPGDTMHVIRSGEVKIPILDKDGRQKLVVHLGPGDLVGEMALLTGEPRNADVYASTAVETVVVSRATLQPVLFENPPLAKFLTEILATRLEADGGIEAVGKYRLLGKLGEGATAKVYEAVHPGLNRVVAIKMLSHALVYDQKFRERFIEEARTIAGLVHPNIVQIFDTEAGYGTYFIVMEKIDGSDLDKLLDERQSLDSAETMGILSEVGKALKYAHEQGIVHRDVKPANVAISSEGSIKLMDFGIAAAVPKEGEKKRRKVVEGTPRYLSPEAAVGEHVDGRADIYALGIMAYEMLTGGVPFDSPNVTRILEAHVYDKPPDIRKKRRDLPDGLAEFVKKTLIKQPEKRLSDWDQIFRLLDPNPEPVADLWSADAQEQVLRVRYVGGARAEVDSALSQLTQRLEKIAGVSVARGQISGKGAADGASRGEKTPAWFRKLKGR